MNGLPISNDPEKKNLNLEIFYGHCWVYLNWQGIWWKYIWRFCWRKRWHYIKGLQRKGVLKINIGSKVNTNAITEANFKLQKDLMAWVLQKNQFQIIPYTIQL
jgi:hypothetical protein